MIVDVDACCDLGCVRQNNEDMILVGDVLLRDRRYGVRLVIDPDQGRLVVAVADGMGGAAAGEWASEYALNRLAELTRNAPPDLDDDELVELLELWAGRAHAELLEQGRARSERSGMGTTIVGLLLREGRAWRFHAGDSRLYRLRDGLCARLTLDHSARQMEGDLARPGHLLVNSLGGGVQSWLEVAPVDGGLHPGDRFLLCSDGLHDLLDDVVLASALRADRETAVRALLRLAHAAGGKDNISVVVIDIARSGHTKADFAVPSA